MKPARIEKQHHAFVYLPVKEHATHVLVKGIYVPFDKNKHKNSTSLFKRTECDVSGDPCKGKWIDIFSGIGWEELRIDNSRKKPGIAYLYTKEKKTLYDPSIHVRILEPSECMFNMRDVSKDIISLKFKKSDTISQCFKKFYDIMRKHGIRHGSPAFDDNGNRVGRTATNFEWSICRELFMQTLTSQFTFFDLFDVPADLAE